VPLLKVRYPEQVQYSLQTRSVLGSIRRQLGFARVVVVNGPRQAGKTSLLRLLQAELGGEYQSLDDATVLRAARSDPAGFVLESGRPTFIDEVQRGGDPLVLAVKSAVDRVPTPGQFILAGSTRFLFEPRLSESLAGRAVICDLWPFSQGEIEGRIGEDFVSRAFRGVRSLLELDIAGETRARTFERVCGPVVGPKSA
jgi:uncharacterized protein